MRRAAGFTLVEIMIVVSIIALLALLAIPSLLRARERTRKTRFVNALRVARDACDLYAMEHNGYPTDQTPGIWPSGLTSYFNGKFDWTTPTPIGGRWDWEYGVYGIKAGISAYRPDETAGEMAEIDTMIDDGDPSSGAFRETAPNRYTWILEE